MHDSEKFRTSFCYEYACYFVARELLLHYPKSFCIKNNLKNITIAQIQVSQFVFLWCTDTTRVKYLLQKRDNNNKNVYFNGIFYSARKHNTQSSTLLVKMTYFLHTQKLTGICMGICSFVIDIQSKEDLDNA